MADTDVAATGAAAQQPSNATLWSRRDFFGRLGWMGFGLVSVASLLAAMRTAFPRVLFAPDTTFKAGPIDSFIVGEVDEKFKSDYRVWIIREAEGIYAIFAKCTHLGCTPRWLSAESKFKCPCHGSGFYRSGINFEGPAPRPLERGTGRPVRGRPTRRRRRREIQAGKGRLGQARVVPEDLTISSRTSESGTEHR